MSLHDYDGMQLLDFRGEPVGLICQTYADSQDVPRFVEVKVDDGEEPYRLVPLETIQESQAGLGTRFGRNFIFHSPASRETGETLEGDGLERVRSYYDRYDQLAAPQQTVDQTSNQPAPSEPGPEISPDDMSSVRDLGDVIEVPVVEEVLVKKPVVTEVIRVRKRASVGRELVTEDLRREDVEVVQEGGEDVDEGGTTSRTSTES